VRKIPWSEKSSAAYKELAYGALLRLPDKTVLIILFARPSTRQLSIVDVVLYCINFLLMIEVVPAARLPVMKDTFKQTGLPNICQA